MGSFSWATVETTSIPRLRHSNSPCDIYKTNVAQVDWTIQLNAK